jgi:tripartite-type tricarboxylate transporter receptor subunit TctC
LKAILAAALCLITPASLLAQSAYPEKPIRLVVGFSAGGPTDLPARFIAERLGAALGQRVVVENRPGAGGQIATQDVLARPRDGYNLLFCTHFEAINAAINRNAGYRLGDIAPISQVARYYYGVVIANSVPAAGWDDFVAYAKANPGKLNYGTVGRASAQEILVLELGKLTGIEMTGIAYKGGAEVMNDLIPGRVHFYVSPTLAVLPHYKAGRLKLIAVTSAERLAVAPEIPTVAEKGFPFVRYGWLGLCAGAGTPRAIIDQLSRETVAIVQSPDYRSLIESAGSVPLASTPEELARILAETYEQTARAARAFGLVGEKP